MNSAIHFMNDFLAIFLLPLDSLKPHEHCCPHNCNSLLEQITMKQHWTHPLLVHKETKIIMDGHHRYHTAQRLGLKHIPCVLISYTNPYLKVYFNQDNSLFDNQLIIEAGQSGKLFDKKSTRHELAINCIPQTNIPLTLLQ